MIYNRGHTDAVLCLQFDKTKVLSGSKDTTIKVDFLMTNDVLHYIAMDTC